MPNIKSAKKRVLVSATKQARNKSSNSALKTAIKKANAAIEANAEDKDALVKAAIKRSIRPLPRACCTRTTPRANSPRW